MRETPQAMSETPGSAARGRPWRGGRAMRGALRWAWWLVPLLLGLAFSDVLVPQASYSAFTAGAGNGSNGWSASTRA